MSKKDIDETIGDSQLDKLMGTENKSHGDLFTTTKYDDDNWLDGLDDEPPQYNNDILEIPEVLKKQVRPKVKVAKPKPQRSHANLTTSEISRLIEKSFAALMKPLDDKGIIIRDEHYFGLRLWLRDCIKTGVIHDPNTSDYYSQVSEVEDEG